MKLKIFCSCSLVSFLIGLRTYQHPCIYVHMVRGQVLASIKLIRPVSRQYSFTCQINSDSCAEPQSSLSCFLCLKVEGKGEGHPTTGHEGPEVEYEYTTPSLTSALDRGGWSTPRPGRFTLGKVTVPIV